MHIKHAERTQSQDGIGAPEDPVAPTTAGPGQMATASPAWYGRSNDAFSWLAVLGGLWIAISPWVMGFETTSPRLGINNLVIGLAAAFIAMGMMTALRGITGSGLANVILGAWIIATAFVLVTPPASIAFKISQIVGGAVILVFAAAGWAGSQRPTRM